MEDRKGGNGIGRKEEKGLWKIEFRYEERG